MGIRSSYGSSVYASGESSVIVMPTDSAKVGSKPPILLCSGRGATAWQMYADPYTGHFVRPVVEAGYPVLCVSPGGTVSWGNATAMTRISDALAYIGARFSIRSDKCFVGGFSMGGMAALNFGRLNPSLVLGVAAFCPAVDLVTLHATYPAEIDAAYGGASWQANSLNYDPTRNAHPPSVPTKVWYATDDATVVTATQTAFFAANPSVQSISLGAVGHSPLTVPADSLRAFASSIA